MPNVPHTAVAGDRWELNAVIAILYECVWQMIGCKSCEYREIGYKIMPTDYINQTPISLYGYVNLIIYKHRNQTHKPMH